MIHFRGARRFHLALDSGSGRTLCGSGYGKPSTFRGFADEASEDQLDLLCKNCQKEWGRARV